LVAVALAAPAPAGAAKPFCPLPVLCQPSPTPSPTPAPEPTPEPEPATPPPDNSGSGTTTTTPRYVPPPFRPYYRAISNERTITYWSHPYSFAFIRYGAYWGSRRFAAIRQRTEDGFPEIYVVLGRYVDRYKHEWLRIRVPMRPNGRIGYVPRAALGPLYRVSTQLVINRHTLRASLYRYGRMVFNAPVGVGKYSTPTPAGYFWIREKFTIRSAHTIYGPLAFGTANYSVLSEWPGGGVVGIHGTNEPQLVPGRPSHGCIRMHNADILRLGRLMPLGTPLRVI
jgi:hypothetical protein